MSSLPFLRLIAVPCVAAAIVGRPNVALAGDGARADALYEEGQSFMKAERYADACDRFAESQRISPSGGAELNLGECNTKLGRFAEAWNAYGAAAKTAHAANKPDIETYARGRATAIEPRVARVTIDAAVTPGGAEAFSFDGAPIQLREWSELHAVTPGNHKLGARAWDHTPFELDVQLAAGEARDLHVPVLAPGTDRSASLQSGDAKPGEEPPREVHPSSVSPRFIAGIALTAIGGVGLVAAAGVGGAALAKNSAAAKECPNDQCSHQGWDDTGTAVNLARASDALFAIGGIAAGVGIILIATAPHDGGAANRTGLASPPVIAIRPWAGTTGAGLGVSGAF